MKKLEQYVIYIGLTVSILFNVVCGLSIISLNNDITKMEEYVDKTAKHTMKLIRYNKQDIEMLENYIDIEFGYKLIDTTKVDEVVLDTAAINELVN